MRIIDVEQGSPEWIQARLGVVTASRMDQIITPKTMKPSASQAKLLATLCAEWFLGVPMDEYVSPFMERGTQMEASAVTAYEMLREVDTAKVGFCLMANELVGASPDRLVETDGTLEIKCPSAETHMLYLIDQQRLVDDYWCQCQGQLYVTGRQWADLFSYSPVFPSVTVRVDLHPEFQAALHVCVSAFIGRLQAEREKLAPDKAKYDEAARAAQIEDDVFCQIPTPASISMEARL